jgi:hypothetical protein
MSFEIVGHQTESLNSSHVSATRRVEATSWNRLISCALQHTGTTGRSRSEACNSCDGSGARPPQMLGGLPVSRKQSRSPTSSHCRTHGGLYRLPTALSTRIVAVTGGTRMVSSVQLIIRPGTYRSTLHLWLHRVDHGDFHSTRRRDWADTATCRHYGMVRAIFDSR